MEPRCSSSYAAQLAELFKQRRKKPFPVLEHSFTRFSDLQASVAYAESLSAVEYLRDRYGMGEVLRMLHNIGSGAGAEETLATQHGAGLFDAREKTRRVLGGSSNPVVVCLSAGLARNTKY
jgi:hypothetical protein